MNFICFFYKFVSSKKTISLAQNQFLFYSLLDLYIRLK